MHTVTLGCHRWTNVLQRCDPVVPLSAFSLKQQSYAFSTIKSGHDRAKQSLFSKLGFNEDEEAQCIQRSLRDLESSFLLQAKKLHDPVGHNKNRAKLEELKDAYLLLRHDTFRRNYASHHCSSNDVRLHILQDGGQLAANFNPEHREFHFIDHSIAKDTVEQGVAKKNHLGIGVKHESSGSYALSSFCDFRDAFRDATGTAESSTRACDVRPYHAADLKAPVRGESISFLLKISFEESLVGCSKNIEYKKNLKCSGCEGTGCRKLRKTRPCQQCLGRGSVHLPSATYHIERKCNYCNGEGTAIAPRCTHCQGRGVLLNQTVQLAVCVEAGTTPNRIFRLRGKGHDGLRGGQSGDLVISILVTEHRYFHRRGNDLHAMLPLTLSIALLGGVVKVTTLHGPASLRVPPCVSNGQILSLSRFGLFPDFVQSSTRKGLEKQGKEKNGTHTSGLDHSRLSDHFDSHVHQGDIFYHVLVLIPNGSRLTGRQKEALGKYENVTAGYFSPKLSMDVKPNGHDEETAERLRECAACKIKYSHWFRG